MKRFERASRTRLAAVKDLAPRFVREAMNVDYENSLITDESDLRDFADMFGDRQAEVAAMLDRLQAHYNVDGRIAGSTRIVELLEFLQSKGVSG